jgi:peptidoglycan glycosyltransferase
MSVVMATLANDGVRPVPRLVLSVGNETAPARGEPRAVLSAVVARQAQAILGQAFDTGRREAALPAVDIAGRAGSADSGLAGAPPHAWFVGFAPVGQPRYAIVVIVEHGYQGWETAAPIAIQVLAQVIGKGG